MTGAAARPQKVCCRDYMVPEVSENVHSAHESQTPECVGVAHCAASFANGEVCMLLHLRQSHPVATGGRREERRKHVLRDGLVFLRLGLASALLVWTFLLHQTSVRRAWSSPHLASSTRRRSPSPSFERAPQPNVPIPSNRGPDLRLRDVLQCKCWP